MGKPEHDMDVHDVFEAKMNSWIILIKGNFLTTLRHVSFSGRTLMHRVMYLYIYM
jgi:hypothetical protein